MPNSSDARMGLNLVVAAIILWNTLEVARAGGELQREGMQITEEQLADLSPVDWEHMNLMGDYVGDLTMKSPLALSVQFSGFDTLTRVSAKLRKRAYLDCKSAA